MKILLADDHPLFMAGISQSLFEFPECEIIAKVKNGEEALDEIISLVPDVAILDIRMPEKSGIEVLESMIECNKATKVILLTMYKNPNYFYRAVSLGAKGYLSKEDAVAEIIQAVNTVYEGGSYVSSSLLQLLKAKEKSKEEIEHTINAISTLTKAEKEVLKLIGEWKTNNEIGEILYISPRTVGNHRTNISSKLSLHGTHGLIKFALENKDMF